MDIISHISWKYPCSVDIICILWKYLHMWILSVFCGNIHVQWILSTFCGYYAHFVDIISISWILYAFFGYYLHLMDITCIGHITSYLDRNVCHVLHSFFLIMDTIFIAHILHSFFLYVDIICIGHITSHLARSVHPIFHIYSSSVSSWCKSLLV